MRNILMLWSALGALMLLLGCSTMVAADVALIFDNKAAAASLSLAINSESGGALHTSSTMSDIYEHCERYNAVVVDNTSTLTLLSSQCKETSLFLTNTPHITYHNLDDELRTKVTYIPHEVPPRETLKLIVRTRPLARRVGVMYGPSQGAKADFEALRKSLHNNQITLKGIVIDSSQHLAIQLAPALDNIDAILVMADKDVVNLNSIRPLLLMTARRHIPLFGGVSEEYIRAGIALGEFTSNNWRAAAIVARLKGEPLPDIKDEDIDITYNQNVVSILRLQVPPGAVGATGGD